MRKFIVILGLATPTLLAGCFATQAETWRGAQDIPVAARNFTPVEPAACRGRGPHCRAGFTWVCHRWRGC